MKRFFPKSLCEFRNCFIACYLISSAMIGHYAYKSYNAFFAEKKFMMELASYKIASDLVNIFDHAEASLDEINQKIVTSDRSNKALASIMLEAGKSYSQSLLKYELSTGKFYWIDAANRLLANSEVGLIDNPIDLANRDYLQYTTHAPRKIYVGEPIVGALSGQYVIPMGVGTHDNHGRYLGTMAVSFKLADLAKRYSMISDAYDVNFALLSANNEMIFESESGIFKNDKRLFNELSSREISVAEEFIAPFSLNKRANSYVILRASDKYQYKVLAGYQNKVLRKELATKMFCCLLQFIIVSLFFVVAMFYMRRDCKL